MAEMDVAAVLRDEVETIRRANAWEYDHVENVIAHRLAETLERIAAAFDMRGLE
jgi:hypothetical protein